MYQRLGHARCRNKETEHESPPGILKPSSTCDREIQISLGQLEVYDSVQPATGGLTKFAIQHSNCPDPAALLDV